MNRLTLFAELAVAGFTPPTDLSLDALFDCVDALRRRQAGEMPGLPGGADLVVIHHPSGPQNFRRASALPAGPEIDPWPESRPVAFALASLS